MQYSYLDVLPSASVRYALTPTQGLRVVYGRGLSRPQFSDLIPFQTVTSSGSARTTVSKGNSNIRAEYADNIDVLYETTCPIPVFFRPASSTRISAIHLRPGDLLPAATHLSSRSAEWLRRSRQLRLHRLTGEFPAYIDPAVIQPGQISDPNRSPEGANPALIGQAPNSFNSHHRQLRANRLERSSERRRHGRRPQKVPTATSSSTRTRSICRGPIDSPKASRSLPQRSI